MLAILPLWIILNIYAFLLDVLTIAGGTAAWFLFSTGHPVYGISASLLTLPALSAAIRVHLSYPAKRRAHQTLYQRNSKNLHTASFQEFMGSPCYRMVVRSVLCRIGHPEVYTAVYRDFWGSGMACFSPKPAVVTIFKNADEGARWLQNNRRHFPAAERPSENTMPNQTN